MLVPGVNAGGFDRQFDTLRLKLDFDYSYQTRRYMSVGDQGVRVLLRVGNEIAMIGNAEMGEFLVKITQDSPHSLVIEGRWREFDMMPFEGGTCRMKARSQ